MTESPPHPGVAEFPFWPLRSDGDGDRRVTVCGVDDQLSHALTTTAGPGLRPLPDDVTALLLDLGAPPRLGAHLRLVHDVGCRLVAAVDGLWPGLVEDPDAVRFGAATHDIGKVLHPEELSEPGSLHEQAGFRLLLERGFQEPLARFAATHASWHAEGVGAGDLLVSLADKVWKGHRVKDLEDTFAARVGDRTGQAPWEVFLDLDDVLAPVCDGADVRLAFQNDYSARR